MVWFGLGTLCSVLHCIGGGGLAVWSWWWQIREEEEGDTQLRKTQTNNSCASDVPYSLEGGVIQPNLYFFFVINMLLSL